MRFRVPGFRGSGFQVPGFWGSGFWTLNPRNLEPGTLNLEPYSSLNTFMKSLHGPTSAVYWRASVRAI